MDTSITNYIKQQREKKKKTVQIEPKRIILLHSLPFYRHSSLGIINMILLSSRINEQSLIILAQNLNDLQRFFFLYRQI